MIASKYRFHGHGSLRYLHRNAKNYRSKYFALKVSDNKHRKNSRFAVIVSKKTHKSAVGRNRIRRRIYEIIRQEIPRINGVYDMAVIVLSSEVMNADFKDIELSLRELIQKASDQKP